MCSKSNLSPKVIKDLCDQLRKLESDNMLIREANQNANGLIGELSDQLAEKYEECDELRKHIKEL